MNEEQEPMITIRVAVDIAFASLEMARRMRQQRDKLAGLLRLTLETIDDDAPGKGTTPTDLIWQIRTELQNLEGEV